VPRFSRKIVCDPAYNVTPQVGEREEAHEGREKDEKGKQGYDKVVRHLGGPTWAVVRLDLFPDSPA
jgi:hypothetical protein